jgi:hypothetical protein
LFIKISYIAGGLSKQGVGLGDILISDQIVDYELQKLTHRGPEVNYWVFPADARLLGTAINYKSNQWLKLVKANRPKKGSTKRLWVWEFAKDITQDQNIRRFIKSLTGSI